MMRDEAFGLAFLEAWKDRLMFGTDMVNVDMEFPLGGWLDQKVEEGALSFTACQAIVRGNAKRIFGLGRKLAVNAEEKTDEKTEEKMVKGE